MAFIIPGAQSEPQGDGGLIKDTTTATFVADVMEASKQVPVLVDFWAPWCGPCQMQAPVLEAVAGKIGDKAVIAKVNVDENTEAAGKFGVQSIPTLVLLKDGEEVKRFVGVQNEDDLIAAINDA